MSLFAVPVTIYATAYIRAEDEEKAREIALQNLTDGAIEIPAGEYGTCGTVAEFTGCGFDSAPDISLSPVMTFGEPEPGDVIEEME